MITSANMHCLSAGMRCRFWLLIATFPILLVLACDKKATHPGSIDEVIKLSLSGSEVGVGLNTPIIVTANVDRDAAGDSILFTATGGSFSFSAPSLAAYAPVNLFGEARVNWTPPDLPGSVEFTAKIQTITAYKSITVTPVPAEISFEDLPDSVPIGSKTLVKVLTPSRWAGSPVEIVAPQATLTAAGAVKDGREQGPRILPVSDQTGILYFLLQAPSVPAGLVITASLFGTVETRFVRIYQPS